MPEELTKCKFASKCGKYEKLGEINLICYLKIYYESGISNM